MHAPTESGTEDGCDLSYGTDAIDGSAVLLILDSCWKLDSQLSRPPRTPAQRNERRMSTYKYVA